MTDEETSNNHKTGDVESPGLSVCICTRGRPDGLTQLLDALTRQQDAPPFEVVLIDNNPDGAARMRADAYADRLLVRYDREPVANLSVARNRSVRLARGSFLAFVDDDEEPVPTWLAGLMEALVRNEADAVTGPTRHLFEPAVPLAIRNAPPFTQPYVPPGDRLPWFLMTTGNALVRRDALPDTTHPFRPQFGRTGGEDVDLFRRMELAGRRLYAAGDQALVYERRSLQRANFRWSLRRALRNGGNQADMEWEAMPRLQRLRLGMASLGKAVSFAWRARLVGMHHPLYMNQCQQAACQLGRFLSVCGYRFAEYGGGRG